MNQSSGLRRTGRVCWRRAVGSLAMIGVGAMGCAATHAVTTEFFNTNQTATVVSTNMTSTTISSHGYLFTSTVDGWWYSGISIGGGTPTGRMFYVVWPNGVEAQCITAGPTGPVTTQSSASISIQRVDGMPFDLASFTAKILGSTAGAGAAIEIMPKIAGEDALANPLTFDTTGYAGQSFSYSTPMLTGYDSYSISLWMDFAFTQLTLVDASAAIAPVLSISATATNSLVLSWPADAAGFVLQESADVAGGNWTSVTNAVATVGATNQVIVSPVNGRGFYRLQYF